MTILFAPNYFPKTRTLTFDFLIGSLPGDTIIPKNLYDEDHDEFDDLEDANDRKQMTKLKKAAAAIEQAKQAKLKKGKNKR